MVENIAKRFEKFGTRQGKQSDHLPNEHVVQLSVDSTPVDGKYDNDTMSFYKKQKRKR